MKHVLLINSNRRVPARMLQDREDIQLSVISMPGHLDYYDDGTDVEVVDTIQDLTQVRLAALRIRPRNPFQHVVAPAEWSLQAGGYIRSCFGLAGPDYGVINAFSNKLVMKQRLVAAGLPVTNFRLVNQFTDAAAAAAELGWPVIIKRTHGGGATDMFVLRDEAEVRSLDADECTARLRISPYPMLAEELVDVEAEFHCDGVVVDGTVRFAPVARYFEPVLGSVGGVIGSYTLPDDHPDAKIVSDLHDQVVAALGLTDGVTHLEILKCPQGYLVGEITCRPGGGGIPELVRHQYGVDLWSAFLATSMGEDVDIDRTAAGRADYMIHYMLPRPVGTVTEITPAADLLALPGVVHAEVRTRVGDTTRAPLDSSIYAGIVLLRADTEDQVPGLIAQIGERFRVTVEEGPR